MNTIDLRDFELIQPPVLGTGALAFSVMVDGTVRINGKLREKLDGDGLRIMVNRDGSQILLGMTDSNAHDAHKLPKNGTVRSAPLGGKQGKGHVKPPARYTAEWNEAQGVWLGLHDKHYIFPTHQNSPQKKLTRRKSNLMDMLPKGGH